MGDMLFVHGSPRKPINEYIFPDDCFTNPQKLQQNFDRMEQTTCFVGHTHVPGVFVDDPYFESPNELPEPGRFVLGDERIIVNVGSVGQPRDRDPRASYVIVTGDQLEFIRLEYDVVLPSENGNGRKVRFRDVLVKDRGGRVLNTATVGWFGLRVGSVSLVMEPAQEDAE